MRYKSIYRILITKHDFVIQARNKTTKKHAISLFVSCYEDDCFLINLGVLCVRFVKYNRILPVLFCLHIGHFFISLEQSKHTHTCPQGTMAVSIRLSKHTTHSSASFVGRRRACMKRSRRESMSRIVLTLKCIFMIKNRVISQFRQIEA